MNIIVSPTIVKMFPSLRLGCLYLSGIDNSGTNQRLLATSKELGVKLRTQYPTAESLAEIRKIVTWRDVYRQNKSKPSKYRPTVEALLRRVIKGTDIPIINDVVTAYLIAELEYLHPIGGYDLNHLEGDIRLRLSEGDEPFQGFGADSELTYNGEIVYSDDKRVLTRRWNYRDCLACQITTVSTEIVLMTEVVSDSVSDEEITECLKRAGELIKRACGGDYHIDIITPA